MKKRGNAVKSFFAVPAMCGGAVCWSALYPATGTHLLWIALITFAAWWLPWHRLVVLRRMLWVVALGVSLASGITISQRVAPLVPLWQWILGWVFILLVLGYCGLKPMYEASILGGILLIAAVALTFVLALPMYDGSIEWNGSAVSRVPAGCVVLLGCGLTGWEMAPDKRAARYGGLLSVLVWLLMAALPLLCWSRAVLLQLPLPMLRVWQRLRLFHFACPEALLSAIFALSALWQCGGALGLLKKHLFPKSK